MGYETCGACDTVPCECNERESVSPKITVGRINFGPEKTERIVPRRAPQTPYAKTLDEGAKNDGLGSVDVLKEKHAAGMLLSPEQLIKIGHPNPHGLRDKTEEWDMRPKNIMPGGCVQEGIPGQPILDPLPIPAPTLLSVKDTNPKDAVGTKKWRQYCTVPTTIIWELGVAMLEGARKYGRHNYRIAGVRASVYVDAAKGHIDQWWEGEDIDEESKLNHVTKAIASLAVLRDAMIQDRWVDDRPPKTDMIKLRADLQVAVDGIFERIPEAKDAYLEGDQHEV